MLAEAFTLVLQLPPLAFNAAPPPPSFRAPRELTCPIEALGRPWGPPTPRPLISVPPALDPRRLRLADPVHLVNPLADAFLLFALAGWASSTGGTVEFHPRGTSVPGLAAPLIPPYLPPGLRANPGM